MRRSLAVVGLCVVAACGGGATAPVVAPASSLASAPAARPAPAPSSAAARGPVALAKDAIAASDWPRARAALEPHASAHPDDAQAAYYLGVALEHLGEPALAEARYRAALHASPDLVEAAVNLGALALDADRADDALAVTRAALARRGDDPALLTNLALGLRRKGDAAGAADAYARAVAKQPLDAELRFAYATALVESGKKDAATAELRTALTGATDRALLASIARVFGQAGAYADCTAAFDRALGAGDAAELRVGRGLCRHSLKDEAGARADFAAAVAADPKHAAARFYLGQALLAAGDRKAGLEQLDRAAALDASGPVGKRSKAAAERARAQK